MQKITEKKQTEIRTRCTRQVLLISCQKMSDAEAIQDPVASLLASLPEDDEPLSPLEPSDPKERAKAILERGAPGAARRLVSIAEHADAKDSAPACRAILESVGLGKRETGFPAPPNQLLSAAALLGALVGIGKVLGIREAEALKNVTFQEEPLETTAEAVSDPEGTRELALPAPLHGARPAPAKSVHQSRLRKAAGTKKKPAETRKRR